MQADALQPLLNGNDDDENDQLSDAAKRSSSEVQVQAEDQFSPELLEEATQFLRLQVSFRPLYFINTKTCRH